MHIIIAIELIITYAYTVSNQKKTVFQMTLVCETQSTLVRPNKEKKLADSWDLRPVTQMHSIPII